MLIELAIALLLGLLAGTITGLTPGIHINLISLILVANLSFLTKFEPIIPAIFVSSMAITHTFLDFIPSVYLGAPEEDTFLSVLPGHEMLREGKAHEAVVLTLYGSLIGLLIILITLPMFLTFIPSLYPYLQAILPFILIFLSCYIVLREEFFLTAIVVFFLSGFLGFFSLNLPVQQPLLPLLTGLFGSSALIISLNSNPSIPKQEIAPLKSIVLEKTDLLKTFFGSLISAPLCSFLPGIGAGHAAVLGSEIIPQSKRGFIALLGGINTIVMGVSFVTLFIIGKTRTGAAVAIQEILGKLSASDLTIIILSLLFASVFSFFIGIFISKTVAKNINKINYKKLSIIIILLLILINLFFSNYLGLIVLVCSTALGIFAIESKIKRINLMGALLIPTIVFYLTI